MWVISIETKKKGESVDRISDRNTTGEVPKRCRDDTVISLKCCRHTTLRRESIKFMKQEDRNDRSEKVNNAKKFQKSRIFEKGAKCEKIQKSAESPKDRQNLKIE